MHEKAFWYGLATCQKNAHARPRLDIILNNTVRCHRSVSDRLTWGQMCYEIFIYQKHICCKFQCYIQDIFLYRWCGFSAPWSDIDRQWVLHQSSVMARPVWSILPCKPALIFNSFNYRMGEWQVTETRDKFKVKLVVSYYMPKDLMIVVLVSQVSSSYVKQNRISRTTVIIESL